MPRSRGEAMAALRSLMADLFFRRFYGSEAYYDLILVLNFKNLCI